jgi:DNA-binding CsgD family transcriptional regulator
MYSLLVVIAVVFSRRLTQRGGEKRRGLPLHPLSTATLSRERLLLSIGVLIGLVSYLLGIILILKTTNLVFVGFVLTKVVGAPLSVSTAILAGRLERDTTTTMVSTGSLAAFLIFAVIEYFIADLAAALVCSVALLLFSALCNHLGLTFFLAAAEKQINAHEEPAAITRPLRKILTNGFIAGLLLASVALGFARYSRSAIPGSDTSSLAAALILLLLIIAVLVCRRALNKEIRPSLFFQSALICFSAGVLLPAIAPATLLELSSTLNTIGSALFETVVWLMMAWAIRNCSRQLLAATLSRFVAVAGHLFGTFLVQAEFFSSGVSLSHPRLSALVLIMFYFALILLVISSPALRSLLLAISSDETSPTTSSQAPSGPQAKEDETDSAHDRYWTEPCAKVSSLYGLTAREAEMLCLLAKGRDISFMEDTFVLSRNTVKMHVRHIYQKLDVHSKQEVIDLVESARNEVEFAKR